MLTINQTLKASDRPLGSWSLWMNDTLFNLDKLRITPKRKVPVQFEPVEFTTRNGYEWECEHAYTLVDYVTVNYDDGELVTVCTECNAQLIGEEWISEYTMDR